MKKIVKNKKNIKKDKDSSNKKTKVIGIDQFNDKKPQKINSEDYEDSYINDQSELFDEYNWWTA